MQSVRSVIAGVRRHLARLFWKWALALGIDQEQEIEEAIRLTLKSKMTELGPEFERWVTGNYPKIVERYGEARYTRVIRSRRK